MSTPEPEDRPQRRSFARLVVEDFRSVRRWLVLLGALAGIATAVAVYALVQGGGSADQQRVDQLERRVTDAQQRLRRTGEESDVNQLERRQRGTAEEADFSRLATQVSGIEGRLRRVERDLGDSIDASAGTGRALVRLDNRLERLTTRIGAAERNRRGGR